MTPYPSDDDITLFKDFTSCPDNTTAIKFLQGASNVLDAAVNNYFENPRRYDPALQSYDESAFGQSRYGHEEGELPSFQIDTIDNANVYSSFSRSTAPTRPNSRNSNSSMRVLTDGQENGIVGEEARFGPAVRDHYDNSQWAMTIPEANAAEIYPDVELWDLVRQQGEPVILKPQNSSNLLPALLSIVGRIPLVQKVILEGPPTLESYGSNGSWWTGTPIHTSRIMAADENDSTADDVEFLAELQRIMVFLYCSERLYGSIESLQSTNLMHAAYSSEYGVVVETEAARFLRACSIAHGRSNNRNLVPGLFQSCVVNNDLNIAFEELDITLSPTFHPISLYEAVDRLIWESDPDGDSDHTRFLSNVAPVLVLNLKNLNASQWELNVNIPSEWYLDRYMADNKDATKQMRKSRADCKKQIQRNEEHVATLQSFRTPYDSTIYTVDSVLTGAISYLSEDLDETMMEEDEDLFAASEQEMDTCKAISNRLQTAFKGLHDTIAALESGKKELEQKLDRLSEVFQPQKVQQEGAPELKHKYILRGVSTKPNNVYVPVLKEGDEDEEWWKMEYEPTPAVERQTMALNDVLENAGKESREVLLVYASEQACSVAGINISDPLLDFIKNDNILFKQTRDASAAAWTESAPNHANDPPPYDEEDGAADQHTTADSQANNGWHADPEWESQDGGFDYDQEMRRDAYRPAVPPRPDGPV